MERKNTIIEKINDIILGEIHDKSEFIKLTNDNQTIAETGIDSFDFIMVYLKIGDEFNIDNNIFKEKLGDENPPLNKLINIIEDFGQF